MAACRAVWRLPLNFVDMTSGSGTRMHVAEARYTLDWAITAPANHMTPSAVLFRNRLAVSPLRALFCDGGLA